MTSEEQLFSPEYRKGAPTHIDEAAPAEQPPIEMQLEAEMKEAVKVYGTGKPKREVIRANIIHD